MEEIRFYNHNETNHGQLVINITKRAKQGFLRKKPPGPMFALTSFNHSRKASKTVVVGISHNGTVL